MDLTEQQRLTLWSQFRILADVEGDPTWWEFAEILRRGFEGEYYRLTEGFPEALSEDRCDEVREILHMYVLLQRGYLQLEETEAVEEARLLFPGFDPTAETGCLTYVSFIRENLEEYEDLEVDGPGHDSDAPMLSKYRAMLEVLGNGRRELAAADIREVLAAGPDPGG